MKSIIPIDDALTIDTFRRQNPKAESILRSNNLPNPICPYSTVANQLYNNDYQAMKKLGVSLEYSETKQVKGVQAQLNDRDMANVVQNITSRIHTL